MEMEDSCGEKKTNLKSKEKRKVKRSNVTRKKNCNENKNVKKVCRIFSEEFLNLFRKQKSDLRSLKLNYCQLSERLKLKDAQQEQIRLDNHKMRLDIEEISQRNAQLNKQINLIEKQFEGCFGQKVNKNFVISLKEHFNDEHYRTEIEKIVSQLEL